MAQKISSSPQPVRPDVGTDYVLIALAVGAAALALLYLILL